ncbi:T9SS type A sorting domain-containing protein [Hymenobacter sp. B81]|uniref:T9SS type A sorting domain-containing protein n=1 Tax=Hymenobacter sp. B81 TaxID=3344878 RepID=UPI0037DD1F21
MNKHLLLLLGAAALSLPAAAQSICPATRPAPSPTRPAARPERTALESAGLATRRPTTTVTLPGRSVGHYWEDNISRWTSGIIKTYTYNNQGKPTQITELDSATNRPSYRTNMTYNGQGMVTSELYQHWDGTAYINTGRTQYTYDAQGNETLYRSESWQGGTWQLESAYRTTYTYNPAGAMTQAVYEDWDNGAYVLDGRTLFTLNAANQWTEVLEQSWNGAAYVNDDQIRNIVWHNWNNKQVAYYEAREWDEVTSTWTGEYRTTTTYQPNGSYVEIQQTLTAPGVWTNEDRHTYTFDNFGNETLHQGDTWSGSAWVIDHAYRYLLAYTPTNEVRRAVEQDFNTTTGRYENNYVQTFSNFQTITLANRSGLAAGVAAQVFPNPTVGAAQVELSGLPPQAPLQAELLNALGQVLRTYTLPVQQGRASQQVDLSAQPAGSYLLRVRTADGHAAYRLVKQ